MYNVLSWSYGECIMFCPDCMTYAVDWMSEAITYLLTRTIYGVCARSFPLIINTIIIIIIYPLTTRVAGAQQMISQSVFSIFPVLHCSLGPAELQVCPFPDVVFPTLPLCTLSSSPFNCTLHDGFGQTWWTGDMTILLQFASLYDRQVFVWSDWLLDPGTDFLVGNMVYEMV